MRIRMSDDRGAAAVEFALVLMPLLLIVFGIVDFGRYYNARVSVTHSAREAARLVAFGGDQAAVVAALPTIAPLIPVTVTTVQTCPATATAPPSNARVAARLHLRLHHASTRAFGHRSWDEDNQRNGGNAVRRLKTQRDDGAVAILVALLAVVIFGMAALVVDVGALYAERRELQTGADAGAIAIAQDCSDASCTTASDARAVALDYAKQNASDSLAAVPVICSNDDSLYDDQSVIKRCTTDPSGLAAGVKYVRVTDGTERASTGVAGDDPTTLESIFAPVLPGYTPKQVTADSVAAWGSPARSGPSIPLIISACEWEIWTKNGTAYAPGWPWTPGGEPWAHETEIVTHNPASKTLETGVSDCRSGGGFNYDIAGGFGWLDPPPGDKDCKAEISPTAEVPSKQGMLPCVRTLLANTYQSGVPVEIPIYTLDPVSKNYKVSGWARFVITGYAVAGGDKGAHVLDYNKALPPGATKKACITTESQDCLTGFFLPPLPASSGVPAGPSFGVTVVALIQ